MDQTPILERSNTTSTVPMSAAERRAAEQRVIEQRIVESRRADWLPQALRQKHQRFDMRTRIILGGLALCVVASLFVRVDQVVSAPGRIVPSTKVKVIQHLEGGIVKTLNVKEGDVVREGQPLLELDLATSGMNHDEIVARNSAMAFTRERLLAEANGTPLRFAAPPEQFRGLAESELATYRARQQEHRGTLAVFESQALQLQSKVAEIEVKLQGGEARLKTAQQEFGIANELFKERLISQLDFLERRKAVETLSTEIAALRESIVGARASLAESRAKYAEEVGKYRRRAADELSVVERQATSVKEELARAVDQRSRAVLYSPIAGIVKNLKLQAPGNVVRQGEPMMEIVPADEAIVVEARLSPADRGYLSANNQHATVKVSAYDFLKYGALNGHVTQVAADTNQETDGAPYYKVVITTDKSFLGDARAPLRVSAGMLAEVDLHVGSQPFIWYLIKPVLKLRREAFREP
ncbi:MAG TPA: HlyD family type I secretion periplasmic adaptor subunit [Burkholderiaceae bacterium]|nr:HlyD family type I secretion periplasmic adaptor subunit [Burkholderiaceae bacterium]